MLARVLKSSTGRTPTLARSFSGREGDPTFERDWSTPASKTLYSKVLHGYDVGEARKFSKQEHRWTIQSFVSTALPESAKSYITTSLRENCTFF